MVHVENAPPPSPLKYTFIIHAVHYGHESLQSSHGLSLVPLTHEVWTETWNHALGCSGI